MDAAKKCWYGKLVYSKPLEEIYPSHSHPHYEMYFFLRGDGEYRFGAHTEKMSPYVLILIPPAVEHRFLPLSNTEYERVVIGFEKATVLPELQHLLPDSPQVYRLSANHEIFRALPRLDYVASTYKINDDRLLLQLYINEFLLRLSYVQEGASATEGQTHPFVQQVINFINGNIDKPIDLDMICGALFVSRSHLSNIFSKYMRVPIMEYVKQRKILYAQSLIQNGALPMEAAAACGFDTYSTFYRLYKKFLNRSPEYDKMSRFIDNT